MSQLTVYMSDITSVEVHATKLGNICLEIGGALDVTIYLRPDEASKLAGLLQKTHAELPE